jgi:hypothetical protein
VSSLCRFGFENGAYGQQREASANKELRHSSDQLDTAGNENIDQGEEEEHDVVDIDGELLKLRDMPPLLKHADFGQSYGLEGDGINLHKIKKEEVNEHLVSALFG